MCFIKVTTDGAENCQEIFRILFIKNCMAKFTHPDYAALVAPLFRCATKRGKSNMWELLTRA